MKYLMVMVLLTTLLFGVAVAHGANPMFAGKPNEAHQKKVESGLFAETKASIMAYQKVLHRKISGSMKRFKDSGSYAEFFMVFLISFAYGVFHAVGPGHGKTVAASYFVSEEARPRSAFIMGGGMGILHGISAVTIVVLLKFAFDNLSMRNSEVINEVTQIISYGLIMLVGLWMLVKAVRDTWLNKDASCGCENADPRSMKSLIASVGFVPCPGALIIMLFAFNHDIVYTGVALVGAMSLGMGLTISLIGLLVIFGRKGVMKVTGSAHSASKKIYGFFRIAGATLVMLFGGIFLLGVI